MNWVEFLPGMILFLVAVACFMVNQYLHYSLGKLDTNKSQSPWATYLVGYFFFPMMAILLGISTFRQGVDGHHGSLGYQTALTAGFITLIIALIMTAFHLHYYFFEKRRTR